MIYFGALGADTIDYGNKTDADIDALRTQGKYRIFAYQGTYWPVNTYGVLYVEVANNYTIQYFIKMAEGVTYKRTMVTNAATPTWSGWVMDYSTDILTKPTYLAPLASALGDAGKYPKYREKNLGASESVDLTLSTTMYVFLADTRYFNGIKIVLGATNTIKVVDQVWSQMNWDDVFSFSCTASTMTVTNISNSEKRLRYYLF